MADDEIDLSTEELEWMCAIDYVDKEIQRLARDYPGRWERSELRAMLRRRLRRPVPMSR